MEIILAIVLGTAFGFALHRVGASNPEYIINMLRLTDLHLMKVILFAIALSSGFLFLGMGIDLIDAGHLSVKTSYWGVLIGGAFLGGGWALSGYCPGSGVAALGEGRKDALFFVLGGLVGAEVYMLIYSGLSDSFLLRNIFGGNVTLATTPNETYTGILSGIPGVLVAASIALIFAAVAWKLPSAFRTERANM
ncbi:MAG: YeeE/YedE family protein [Candidatus Marinimicrobia bacterium]|nr:YeeE/YedE family protein [Candidatus Neomarinimicrobiota bacterium]